MKVSALYCAQEASLLLWSARTRHTKDKELSCFFCNNFTRVSHYTQYSPGVGVMTILETSWRLVTASSMLPGLKPTTGDILRL